MAADAHKLFLVCRLTKDPETRALPSGQTVTNMRVAWSSRQKDGAGNWTDRPNYIDVTVWGKQGENCQRFLSKGRQIAVVGRLQWREWEKDGVKRQAHDIVAEDVQFLGGGEQQGGGHSGGGGQQTQTDVPADTQSFAPTSGGVAEPDDSDIPFRAPELPAFEELKGTWRV